MILCFSRFDDIPKEFSVSVFTYYEMLEYMVSLRIVRPIYVELKDPNLFFHICDESAKVLHFSTIFDRLIFLTRTVHHLNMWGCLL